MVTGHLQAAVTICWAIPGALGELLHCAQNKLEGSEVCSSVVYKKSRFVEKKYIFLSRQVLRIAK